MINHYGTPMNSNSTAQFIQELWSHIDYWNGAMEYHHHIHPAEKNSMRASNLGMKARAIVLSDQYDIAKEINK